VLLAGSTARFNVHREGWNGDIERDLAIEALGGEAGRYTVASITPSNKFGGEVKSIQLFCREIDPTELRPRKQPSLG
jgi:hypothetical protein